MIKYYTALTEGKAEQQIEKSRFIGYVKPVSAKEEADEFFDYIRKKHRDATHNVPAMVIGEKMEIQWASDDGEPQGTSGAPVVQMLVSRNVTNTAIMVTRYFGGIKLGTGGLVRAYTSTAKLVLDTAGVAAVKEMVNVMVAFDYTFLGKIQNLSYTGDFSIRNIEYLDKVNATMVVDPEKYNSVKEQIINLTSAKAKFISETKMNEKVKISL